MEFIELIDISKTFDSVNGTTTVLDRINIGMKAGEFIAIVGPSGSGKSTLLNVMGLLEVADSGHIIFEGRDLTSLSDSARTQWRKENLGFIFQFHHLLPEFTAMENVAIIAQLLGLPRKVARARAHELLVDLGLEGVQDKFPAQLSGGEQQRVAIARAIINRPRLLLCDEPTGNLDHANAGRVFALLQELAKREKIAIIMVTHNLELAKKCDRMISL